MLSGAQNAHKTLADFNSYSSERLLVLFYSKLGIPTQDLRAVSSTPGSAGDVKSTYLLAASTVNL